MKKFVLFLLFLFNISSIMPVVAEGSNNGKIASFDASVSRNTVMAGESVSLVVVVSSTTDRPTGLDFTVTYDNNSFLYTGYTVRFINASDTQVIESGGSLHFKYTMQGAALPFPPMLGILIEFSFKANPTSNDTTSTLAYSVSEAFDSSKDYYTIDNVSGSKDITIHVPSTNNNLSSLSLNGATITPVFNKNTLTYRASVNVSSITIEASCEDEKSSITGTGIKELSDGENEFIISVKSEAGATKEYKLVITKEEPKDSDATLKELIVSNTDIKFDGKDTYSQEVEYNIKEVDISATPNSNKAKVINTGIHSLNVGSNIFKIKVTSEAGDTKTYTINIKRKDKKNVNEVSEEKEIKEERFISPNTYLKSLTIDNVDFKFNKNKTTYNLQVDDTIKEIHFNYITESETASVWVLGDTILKNGENRYVITVTAEDGSTLSYNIIINKSFVESKSESTIKRVDVKTSIKTDNKLCIIIISVIVGLVILIVSLVIYKKNRVCKIK